MVLPESVPEETARRCDLMKVIDDEPPPVTEPWKVTRSPSFAVEGPLSAGVNKLLLPVTSSS